MPERDYETIEGNVLSIVENILRVRSGEVKNEDRISDKRQFQDILDDVQNEYDIVFDLADESEVETVQDLIEKVEEMVEEREKAEQEGEGKEGEANG